MSEYELLREELIKKKESNAQFDNILYTVTAGILTYAFGKDGYFLFLIPYIVILPLYLLTENNHRAIIKFATYMYVFLEGEDYHWERRLHTFDEIACVNGIKYSRYLHLFKERAHYFFLSLVCSVTAAYKVIISDMQSDKKWMSCLTICIITLSCIAVMIMNMTDYVKAREEMIGKWQEIKAAEDAQKRKNTRNPQ